MPYRYLIQGAEKLHLQGAGKYGKNRFVTLEATHTDTGKRIRWKVDLVKRKQHRDPQPYPRILVRDVRMIVIDQTATGNASPASPWASPRTPTAHKGVGNELSGASASASPASLAVRAAPYDGDNAVQIDGDNVQTHFVNVCQASLEYIAYRGRLFDDKDERAPERVDLARHSVVRCTLKIVGLTTSNTQFHSSKCCAFPPAP